MSFIIGDEIVTEEIPVELEPILNKLKENTKEKSKLLMNTLAFSDEFIAYIIPNAGMVVFSRELAEDRKVFRYLINNNGELYIDNKQRRGEMFCPLFEMLESQINELSGREADRVNDDQEYRVYNKFMPKVVETINNILTNKSDPLLQ